MQDFKLFFGQIGPTTASLGFPLERFERETTLGRCTNGRKASPVCAFDEYLRGGEIMILLGKMAADLEVFSLPNRVNFLLGNSSEYFLGFDSLLLVTSCTVVLSINIFCSFFPHRAHRRPEICLFLIDLLIFDQSALPHSSHPHSHVLAKPRLPWVTSAARADSPMSTLATTWTCYILGE